MQFQCVFTFILMHFAYFRVLVSNCFYTCHAVWCGLDLMLGLRRESNVAPPYPQVMSAQCMLGTVECCTRGCNIAIPGNTSVEIWQRRFCIRIARKTNKRKVVFRPEKLQKKWKVRELRSIWFQNRHRHDILMQKSCGMVPLAPTAIIFVAKKVNLLDKLQGSF